MATNISVYHKILTPPFIAFLIKAVCSVLNHQTKIHIVLSFTESPWSYVSLVLCGIVLLSVFALSSWRNRRWKHCQYHLLMELGTKTSLFIGFSVPITVPTCQYCKQTDKVRRSERTPVIKLFVVTEYRNPIGTVCFRFEVIDICNGRRIFDMRLL